MRSVSHQAWTARDLGILGLGIVAVLLLARPGHAQLFSGVGSRFELSDAVRLDEADAATKTHLERVKQLLANEQWDEAIDTLRQVMESAGGQLTPATPQRFVSVRDHCHLQIATLPPAVLERYRNQVDPQARRWFEAGVAKRDPTLLLKLVDELFCSSLGDDALWMLGEIALEKGDYGGARGYWEKLIETPPQQVEAAFFEAVRQDAEFPPESATLLDQWYQRVEDLTGVSYVLTGTAEQPTPSQAVAEQLVEIWRLRGLRPPRMAYPASDLPRADIHARLLLVTTLEGSFAAARAGLERYRREFPAASGVMGGRKVDYADFLASLIESGSQWPARPAPTNWHTFAGNFTRTGQADVSLLDVTSVKWRQPLRDPAEKPPAADVGYPSLPVAEDKNEPLSYHPLVMGNLVLVAGERQIRAFDLATGKPAWGGDAVIYPSGGMAAVPPDTIYPRSSSLGTPRFTMTAFGSRLWARIGNPLTSTAQDVQRSAPPARLVCLDLAGEGRLLNAPELEPGWTFEGAPVTDGTWLYIAMRRSDVRPQAHVGCFDVETGRLRWRKFVCSAETPARGALGEVTHNLLTLHQDTLYFNTNLGAVAALRARDGETRWVSLYPRAKQGDLNQRAKHFYRDLTPALYHQGVIVVAPADCERLLALDANTGLTLWQTNSEVQDPIHLLGVVGETLVASGEKLWWIDMQSGKVAHVWPDGSTPKGFGRAMIARDKIYWPSRTETPMIHVFDGHTRLKVSQIELSARGAAAGNLVATSSCLLIATGDELIALDFPETTGDRTASVDQTETNEPSAAKADP